MYISFSLFVVILIGFAKFNDAWFNPKYGYQSISDHVTSVSVDLGPLYNNRAFGNYVNESNYDGYGSGFPAQYMPPPQFTYAGTNYSFPQYKTSGNDNVLCRGQNITVPLGRYSGLCLLASSQSDQASGSIQAHYQDRRSSSHSLLVPSWWNWPYPSGGDVVFPYYLTSYGINYNHTMIYQTCTWLDSTTPLTLLTLPNVSKGPEKGPRGTPTGTRLHLFSLSLIPVPSKVVDGPSLEVKYARSTQKWIEGTNKTQVFEVIITNVGTRFVLRNQSVSVSIQSPGLRTVQKGVINRLAPGDQTSVDIGVVNVDGVPAGKQGEARVVIDGLGVSSKDYTFSTVFGIQTYNHSDDSLDSHESPAWFNEAKFGIFIHWGVYAVPAWGNVGENETYAEWYWWNLNQGPNTKDQTYQYHLNHYNPNITYDDFIANFTASAFSPKEWVDLFADSGASYFVLVTKHHDGYSLFDLPHTVSNRTSVVLPPHRNLVKELFDAAKVHQPHLRRGTYYSVPEWFHPDYAKYGFGDWPGGWSKNPFTNKIVPYTGYVPVKDYLQDLLVPSMETLAALGTDVLWCDIGGPNLTGQFAASWFNSAAMDGRQVTMNNRCGLPGDFDTPEYPRSSPPVVRGRKWEANRGMDPYSYGYNAATPEQAYMDASTIVKTLVDMMSKGGNFLLDIGPRADGSIIDVEAKALREAGSWIREHKEAIFGTRTWWVTPQEGENTRFALTDNAFYIYLLKKPEGRIVIKSPVPWVEGDEITTVGGNLAGTVVKSWKDESGNLIVDTNEEVAQAEKWAWIFKISF